MGQKLFLIAFLDPSKVQISARKVHEAFSLVRVSTNTIPFLIPPHFSSHLLAKSPNFTSIEQI